MHQFTLTNKAKQNGYSLVCKNPTTSTMDDIWKFIADGEASAPLWLVSTDQRKGRGRHSRLWYCQLGNLASTLLLKVNYPLSNIPAISFVASLALYNALKQLQVKYNNPAANISLKWPNDLLIDQQKLAGILIETKLDLDSLTYVLVGIGVNIHTDSEAGVEYPITSVQKEIASQITAEELFLLLSDCWVDYYNIFVGEAGAYKIYDLWFSVADYFDSTLEITTTTQIYNGILRGLDENLDLCLELPDNTLKSIAATSIIKIAR